MNITKKNDSMSKLLFKVPISDGGSFECTEVAPKVYLLTFSYPPDNRIYTSFCDAFLKALDILDYTHPKGVLITTSGIPKFYSNGFDMEHSLENPRYMEDSALPMIARILTFPMPTICLINGHCFGAGWFLAIAHDFRVQNPGKGFICLPEVELGAIMPSPVQQMFKQKMSPQLYRLMVLESVRLGGSQSLEVGAVDALGDVDACLKLINEHKLMGKADAGAWGALKEDAFRETLEAIERYPELVDWRMRIEEQKNQKKKAFQSRNEAMKRNGPKL